MAPPIALAWPVRSWLIRASSLHRLNAAGIGASGMATPPFFVRNWSAGVPESLNLDWPKRLPSVDQITVWDWQFRI